MKTLRLTLATLVLASPALAQFEGVVQMKMTAGMGGGTVTAAVSKVGTRTEMDMQSPEMAQRGMGQGMKMVTIVKNAEPNVVYTINDSAKTYSVMNTKEMREQAAERHKDQTYTVKKLGKDTVAGYSCEKALVTGSEGTEYEVCVAKDMGSGSGLIRVMQRRRGGSSGLLKALTDAGLDGFPARWVTKSREGHDSVTMELVSAKKQSVPDSTFEVPAGYTKSDSAMPVSNPEMDRRMKEALEKMTPEQRKQYEEMMKKRTEGN